MAIPALQSDGLLPPGEYQATWSEIASRFGHNPRRAQLLAGLELAILDLRKAGAKRLYLNGSFVTDKPEPNDYDACYDIDLAALASLPPALRAMTWPRELMKKTYLGDLFPAEFPADALLTKYREFFQQQRDGTPKGIVVLDLETL